MNSEIIKLNARAEELFHDFLDGINENKLSDKQIAARNAIQRSFWKLDYILKLMRASQKRAVEHLRGGGRSKPYSGLDRDYTGQTEVHAESFYCEAHRLKKIMQEKFGFKVFKSAKFISLTLIRNYIVEHTAVNRDASSWGEKTGPRLYVGAAPLAKGHPKITDRGFYQNAKDFYRELNKTIEHTIRTAPKTKS